MKESIQQKKNLPSPLIVIGKTLPAPEVINLPLATAVLFSTAAGSNGKMNEDSAAFVPVSEDTVILAVADGAGGHRGGRRASRRVIETLTRMIEGKSEIDRGTIVDAFESANEAIRQMKNGALSTLAVALIEGETLRTFHAGDSTVMTVKADATICCYTPPHSATGYGVEAGLLSEEEALEHEERHLLVNSLGTADYRIEIGAPLTLKRNDTVLVASDGLMTVLTPEQIAEIVCSGKLSDVADKLLSACSGEEQTNIFQDDLTFILFRQD